MKKGSKYTLLSLGGLIVVTAIAFGIIYAVSPYKVRRLLRIKKHKACEFVDRLKGKPYSKGWYDGIDVSKHNGVIRWNDVAKNKKIKFVFIKATEGKSHVDSFYRNNLTEARKAGLKVGSYHFFTTSSSATEQFQHFKNVVHKSEQDLTPVLDVEEHGKNGCQWHGKQLQDSVRVFAELVKNHYGKYPIIYSNEHFYNNELGHKFNNHYLFIAKYKKHEPNVDGGKHNIWQYTKRGHLQGIGERVDMNRLTNGTTVADLAL